MVGLCSNICCLCVIDDDVNLLHVTSLQFMFASCAVDCNNENTPPYSGTTHGNVQSSAPSTVLQSSEQIRASQETVTSRAYNHQDENRPHIYHVLAQHILRV